MLLANEKILKALKSAMTHLGESMLVGGEEGEGSLEDSIWHVAAELEYALFMFSITLQGEIDNSNLKVNPKLKEVEVTPILATVQKLLNEAEKSMMKEKSLDAYKSTLVARHHVLKIQKDLTKKRREALKKKK